MSSDIGKSIKDMVHGMLGLADRDSDRTIFEYILDGTVESKKVYEDDVVYAFEDLHKQAPVHVLVIPKQKIVSFKDVKDCGVSIGEYFKKISHVAHVLGLEEDGYRVVFNHGADGGQTVDYIHAHILGGRTMKWPPG